MSGSGPATFSHLIRSERKKRQIRRVLSGLPRRSVVLVEDETDLLLFRATREVAISIVQEESDMETT
jgi:hypothetical protein